MSYRDWVSGSEKVRTSHMGQMYEPVVTLLFIVRNLQDRLDEHRSVKSLLIIIIIDSRWQAVHV
jgi:hypothetical protein